jgi:hypothetical protein
MVMWLLQCGGWMAVGGEQGKPLQQQTEGE